MIIGFSGKKQSGKSTSSNFIISLFIAQLEIAEKVSINPNGQIVVSDLLNDRNYAGIFDLSNINRNDFILNKVAEKLDKHIKVYSFADPLKKDICMNILGLTYEQCYGSDEEKNVLTDLTWDNKQLSGREAMEIIGTNIFRTLKNNVWVETTIKKIKQEKPSIAIIADCRFPNEADAIKRENGKVVRLTRNPFSSSAKAEVALDKENYDWSNFDYICDNEKMNIYDQCMDIQKFLQEILPL
jgi:hypothetical protein